VISPGSKEYDYEELRNDLALRKQEPPRPHVSFIPSARITTDDPISFAEMAPGYASDLHSHAAMKAVHGPVHEGVGQLRSQHVLAKLWPSSDQWRASYVDFAISMAKARAPTKTSRSIAASFCACS
jgi:hypothetical protein